MQSPRDFEIAKRLAEKIKRASTRAEKVRIVKLWYAHMMAAVTGKPVDAQFVEATLSDQERLDRLLGVQVTPLGGGDGQ